MQEAEAGGHVYTLFFKQNRYDLMRGKGIIVRQRWGQLPLSPHHRRLGRGNKSFKCQNWRRKQLSFDIIWNISSCICWSCWLKFALSWIKPVLWLHFCLKVCFFFFKLNSKTLHFWEAAHTRTLPPGGDKVPINPPFSVPLYAGSLSTDVRGGGKQMKWSTAPFAYRSAASPRLGAGLEKKTCPLSGGSSSSKELNQDHTTIMNGNTSQPRKLSSN